jgi:lysozyme family protein
MVAGMAVQTSPRFRACMPFILKEEGGYSNDAHDSGGMTMHGIIQREYDRYRKSKGLPLQWVKKISEDEQNDIYWTEYWLPRCPNLPAGLDLSFFNIAVNGGPSEATRLLQQALGISIDGNYGPETSRVVSLIKPGDVPRLIRSFDTDEENWYRHLSKFKYFGKDWIGRAQRCRVASLAMVVPDTLDKALDDFTNHPPASIMKDGPK